MRFLEDQVAVQALKDHMGYVADSARCDTCGDFVPAHSGESTVLAAHCELNPAAFFPVEEGGRCRHHKLPSEEGRSEAPRKKVDPKGTGFHG